MRFVIFGLTVSSSWGNGHATLWRGLLKALSARGHTITFYEKDVPYYAETRDGWQPPPSVDVRLFGSLTDVRDVAKRELSEADIAMVTSYCGEGAAACELVLQSNARLKVFYDLDTPVTLHTLALGERVPYLPDDGLAGFEIVLSYTGGHALQELQTRLGAQRVAPLYGWVDPEIHCPTEPRAEFRSELSYLGTYAADRQAALKELFVRAAHALPGVRFAVGGAQYPESFPWAENIFFVRHLPPALHPAFFCSGRATLNVTRQTMAKHGYCPSGRLFEAAACGTPIMTDVWEGLETFFHLETEILPVRTGEDVLARLTLSDAELLRIAEAARARTLQQHTAAVRAVELERILDEATTGQVHSIEPDSVGFA